MVMYNLLNYYIYIQNIINMPCGNLFYCAICHNLGPSLIIIMDDGDQYFEKKIMSKNLHNAACQILIDG
jgi:hypothetical protein